MTLVGTRMLGALLLCLAGAAGAAERATVSALGSAEASVAPDFVRFMSYIQERGTKIDDLLKALSTRGAEIEKKLKPLGAAVITIADPEVIPIPADARRQGSSAIARLKAIKQGQEGEEAFAHLRITVEFALTGDPKAQVIAAAGFRRQLGELLKQPVKEDEESTGDEDESSVMRMVSGDSAKPGTVVALYGKRPSDDVNKKLMQEAYAHAEAAARGMAEAAGQTLGPLVSLSRPTRVEEDQSESVDYSTRQYLSRLGADAKRAGELLNLRHAPLTHRASVLATFELKAK